MIRGVLDRANVRRPIYIGPIQTNLNPAFGKLLAAHFLHTRRVLGANES